MLFILSGDATAAALAPISSLSTTSCACDLARLYLL